LTIMPEHPSLANPACPNTLGDIIMKMIAKRPELRFNDCDELSVAITQMSRSRI